MDSVAAHALRHFQLEVLPCSSLSLPVILQLCVVSPPLSTHCLEPLNTTANPHAPHLAHPRTRGRSLSRPTRGTLHHLLRRVGAAAVAGRVRCPTMNKSHSHAAPVCVCTSTCPLHVYLLHGLRCYFIRDCVVWLAVYNTYPTNNTHT